MVSRWMNAYKNGGERLVLNNSTPTVLYELTAPDVPESAREGAGGVGLWVKKKSTFKLYERGKNIWAKVYTCRLFKQSPHNG